ncbi:MAG: hypothetical protein HY515_03990, partial [Candidatus Aenigmarchaeota archaeon]|nr:hypothetical protein [Candidatus Aenigmarchaeota archaeon]
GYSDSLVASLAGTSAYLNTPQGRQTLAFATPKPAPTPVSVFPKGPLPLNAGEQLMLQFTTRNATPMPENLTLRLQDLGILPPASKQTFSLENTKPDSLVNNDITHVAPPASEATPFDSSKKTKTTRSPYANYPDQATTPAGTNTNPDFIYMNGTFIPTVNGPGGRYPITAKPAELAQLYQDGQIPKKAFDNAMASKFQAREYALSVYARESMGGSYTSSILQNNYLMNEIDTPQVQYEYALAVSNGDKGAQAYLKSVIDGNPTSNFFHTLGNIDLGLFSTTYRLGYELAADPTPTRAVVLGIAVAPVPKPVNTLISRIFTGTKNLFGAAKGTLGSLLERAPGRTYMTKLFHTPTTREQLTSTRSVIRPITTAVTETIPKTWTPNEQNVIRQPGEIIGKSAVKESPGFRGHLEEVRQGGLTRFEEVGKRTGWTKEQTIDKSYETAANGIEIEGYAYGDRRAFVKYYETLDGKLEPVVVLTESDGITVFNILSEDSTRVVKKIANGEWKWSVLVKN